jgi:hypothetical protein
MNAREGAGMKGMPGICRIPGFQMLNEIAKIRNCKSSVVYMYIARVPAQAWKYFRRFIPGTENSALEDEEQSNFLAKESEK